MRGPAPALLLLATAILAGLAVAVRLSPPSFGFGDSCEADPRFERTSIIKVSGAMPETRYSNALATAEIEALRSDRALPASQRIPGLTVADYGLDARYRMSSSRRANSRRACVWLDSLEATLTYAKMDVYVAKEYPPGSCQYSQIAVHEGQHVLTHQQVYEEFRLKVEEALRAAAFLPTKANPMSVDDPDEGRKLIGRLVDKVLEPLRTQLAEELARRQAQLDTPRSYRDLQARCGDWRR